MMQSKHYEQNIRDAKLDQIRFEVGMNIGFAQTNNRVSLRDNDGSLANALNTPMKSVAGGMHSRRESNLKGLHVNTRNINN